MEWGLFTLTALLTPGSLAVPAGAQFSSYPEAGDDGQVQPSVLFCPFRQNYINVVFLPGGVLSEEEQPVGLHTI